MLTALFGLGVAAWAAITVPAENFRRLETTMLYQPYVNESQYAVIGCLSGAAAGAMVGSMPVVTTLGVVAAPYSIGEGALLGCSAGAAAALAGAKLYNAGALYLKYLHTSPDADSP